MNIDQRLYVNNKYLDHLIFGDWIELEHFFENIYSWVDNGHPNKQEAKFLLTEMACSIFTVPLNVTFGYREDVISRIQNKLDYHLIEQDMQKEMKRLYNLTQKNLKEKYEKKSIVLYRGLNPNELDCFYKDPSKIKTNMLSSFTIDPNRYGREVQISVKVSIENVLFYENLCPFKELVEQNYACSLGLHKEREVIVFNKEEFLEIEEITYMNERRKRAREAKESF
ncbi:hypothetical protein EXW39_29945 (plasmid) [Bacillus mycoides]|uniref:hypothetical protein n=1 Tax=Bacillus mycoides TaxID=1405 RepID=UPI001C01CC85|nr:hypothetical protein [Bacillus mycoides]QWH64265.1 hypothetical protein EXW39_29945 [Bacillus mycoides]